MALLWLSTDIATTSYFTSAKLFRLCGVFIRSQRLSEQFRLCPLVIMHDKNDHVMKYIRKDRHTLIYMFFYFIKLSLYLWNIVLQIHHKNIQLYDYYIYKK